MTCLRVRVNKHFGDYYTSTTKGNSIYCDFRNLRSVTDLFTLTLNSKQVNRFFVYWDQFDMHVRVNVNVCIKTSTVEEKFIKAFLKP